MTSYVTDVDFISDHFPAFWQAWLNIFLKLILKCALSSVILSFIKIASHENTRGIELKKKTLFQCAYTLFTSRFLLWFEFQFVIVLDDLE